MTGLRDEEVVFKEELRTAEDAAKESMQKHQAKQREVEAAEEAQPEVWSWRNVVREARIKLEQKGLPKPVKPKTGMAELEFPEDITTITAPGLANLMIKFQGWYAYTTTELAYLKAEQASIAEVFEAKVGFAQSEIVTKATKDEKRAVVLQYPNIKPWFKIKLMADHEVAIVQGLEASLKIQCFALRDEQIRRMSASKVENSF